MKLVGVVVFCALANGQVPPLVLRNAASFTSEIAPGSMVEIVPSFSVTEVLLNDRPIQIVRPPRFGFAWAVIPPDAAPGQARVVASEGETRYETTVTIRQHAPGLFAANNGGSGPALAANSLTNPALAGQFVTLWGTGLGEARDVFVNLGGRVVRAQYAGHHPDYPGLDQINFEVPASIGIGCYVPVSIRVGDAESNRVTLAVSDSAGACPHPLGLSYSDLVTLDAGGTILAGDGNLTFLDGQSFASRFQVVRRNAAGVFSIAGVQQPDSELLGCRASSAGAAGGPGPGTPGSGPTLTLTAPNGSRFDATTQAGFYTWTDPMPLLPGQWLLSGSGNDVFGPFQQTWRVPPGLRDAKLAGSTFTWNPFGYASGDLLQFTLGSLGGPRISCVTHAWTGQIVVPAEQMAQLSPTILFTTATIFPHLASRTHFRIPLTAGGTAPVVLTYSITTVNVTAIR